MFFDFAAHEGNIINGYGWVFAGLYYLLPNLTNYNAITPAAHGQMPGIQSLATAALYGLIYIGVLLAATGLVFSRRNLK